MKVTLLMTILGPDRPGIVETLSRLVAEAGGSWLESNMSHLAGHFAGMVQLSIPFEQVDGLRAKLADLKKDGLVCTVQDSKERYGAKRGTCYTLDIIGQDRAGIVRSLTDVICQSGGNVEKFDSHVESAPMTGEQLFKAKIRVCFSEDAAVDGLQAKISEIGNELLLDVTWRSDAG